MSWPILRRRQKEAKPPYEHIEMLLNPNATLTQDILEIHFNGLDYFGVRCHHMLRVRLRVVADEEAPLGKLPVAVDVFDICHATESLVAPGA